MSDVFDRLSQGPQRSQRRRSSARDDFEDWDQMVGSAPRDRFEREADRAVRQVDPDEYYRHSQPGIEDTDPFGQLPEPKKAGLAESLLGALFGSGAQPRQVFGDQYRGGNIDPRSLSPQQLAQIAQYLQRNNPEALGRVASQYQDQPDILETLLGNKALLALAAGLGAKFLSDRANRNRR